MLLERELRASSSAARVEAGVSGGVSGRAGGSARSRAGQDAGAGGWDVSFGFGSQRSGRDGE